MSPPSLPKLTIYEMEAAAQTALALDRARCDEIPHDESIERIYMVGFAAGADWTLKRMMGDL